MKHAIVAHLKRIQEFYGEALLGISRNIEQEVAIISRRLYETVASLRQTNVFERVRARLGLADDVFDAYRERVLTYSPRIAHQAAAWMHGNSFIIAALI